MKKKPLSAVAVFALTLLAGSAFGDDVCLDFDAADGTTDLTNWTVFNVGELDVNWTGHEDMACTGGIGGNLTVGMDGAACAESFTVGPGLVDTYLCSPELNFAAASMAIIQFDYFLNVAQPPAGDVLECLVGNELPSASTIAEYTSVFTETSSGGASASVPIAGFATGYVCFRYRASDGYWTMVDNLSVGPDACGLSERDVDSDTIADDADNCIIFPDATQRDTDNDGFGNQCDPDFNNDCAVNFLDLAVMKENFFAFDSANTDLDGDGATSFNDLARLRSLAFEEPGPSAIASCSN